MRCPGIFGASRPATAAVVVVRCTMPGGALGGRGGDGTLGAVPSGGGVDPAAGESPPSRAMRRSIRRSSGTP